VNTVIVDRLPKINCCQIAVISFSGFVTKRNIVAQIHEDFCKMFNAVLRERKYFGLENIGHKKCKYTATGRLLRTELKEPSRDKNSN